MSKEQLTVQANPIHEAVAQALLAAGVAGSVEFSPPPNPQLGDVAFACFSYAKEQGTNPKEAAEQLAEKINHPLIAAAQATGPYLNLKLDAREVAKLLLEAVDGDFGMHRIGEGKRYVVEYACPNPLKAFHLGHLKNLITGEAVARMFENAGYQVVRVNYQGDVGMHVAKALWGIFDWKDQFEQMAEKPLRERVEFLGKAYAHGAQRYESGEEGKQEIVAYNDKVYERAEDIQDVYQTARQWSLEYFDTIYKRLGSRFDRLYFESQTYEGGVALVKAFLEKGVFKESEGAIIYEGSKHGLHDRVFINSKGFPTYEAKDLELARQHFANHHPDKVIHVVGKEQTEYFKVVFQAMEEVLPETIGKEEHLIGGFLQLKSGKMSSRTGNIITGDALLNLVSEKVQASMEETEVEEKDEVVERVTAAALKYAMLRADVSKDVAFDMEASVSTSGDSGPYLLYMVARIHSLLEKAGKREPVIAPPVEVEDAVKRLLLLLADYPAVTRAAAEAYDPSKIARFLFELAQEFNKFYEECPVLKAEGATRNFRLHVVEMTAQVMKAGLRVIGIEPVERM